MVLASYIAAPSERRVVPPSSFVALLGLWRDRSKMRDGESSTLIQFRNA